MEIGMLAHRVDELEKIVEILDGKVSELEAKLADYEMPLPYDLPSFDPDHEPNPVPGELSKAEADAATEAANAFGDPDASLRTVDVFPLPNGSMTSPRKKP